jgi:uncharacterized protein (TIGR00255 family)
MESMTGYSFIEKSNDQFSYAVELKSLNSRYLEININLPRILRNEESNFNNIIREYFSRGKIDLTIDILEWNTRKNISLNSEVIASYYRELKKIHESLGLDEELKFESVLSLDGITQRAASHITQKSMKQMIAVLKQVIGKTIQMRKREGQATRKDITNSLNFIKKEVSLIKQIAGKVAVEKKKKLKERLENLAGNSIDDNRLYSEIAILADKLDINEELVRLNDHIAKFRKTLSQGDQIGRKLDFLAQEIFREANTIGSKSNSSDVSHHVVEIKNHIDKMREQCRNIV